jgi:hypothetical protein
MNAPDDIPDMELSLIAALYECSVADSAQQAVLEDAARSDIAIAKSPECRLRLPRNRNFDLCRPHAIVVSAIAPINSRHPIMSFPDAD